MMYAEHKDNSLLTRFVCLNLNCLIINLLENFILIPHY